MKWLCWCLWEDDRRLTERKLCVVGDWLTEGEIRDDAERFLPKIRCLVDNDIAFSDGRWSH